MRVSHINQVYFCTCFSIHHSGLLWPKGFLNIKNYMVSMSAFFFSKGRRLRFVLIFSSRLSESRFKLAHWSCAQPVNPLAALKISRVGLASSHYKGAQSRAPKPLCKSKKETGSFSNAVGHQALIPVKHWFFFSFYTFLFHIHNTLNASDSISETMIHCFLQGYPLVHSCFILLSNITSLWHETASITLS